MTITESEKELIVLIASGKRSKEIADITKYAEASVETNRVRLMKKLRVRNASHLVAYAYQNKILTLEP